MSSPGGLCRVCLRHGGDMRGLYDAEHDRRSEKMVFCTGLQIYENDGLPSHICAPCAALLDTAFQFKTACLSADAALRGSTVKLEDAVEEQNGSDAGDDLKSDLDEKETGALAVVKLEPQADMNEGFDAIAEGRVVKRRKKNEPRTAKSKPAKPEKLLKRRRPLWCEICLIKFPDKASARGHAHDMHKSELSLVCEFCGKVFEHRSSQYYHLRSHLPPTFSCDLCAYSTWHKHDLEKHKRTHSDVKRYQCEFCTAAYHTVSNLHSHIRRTHERRRDYSCHICAHKFFDKRKMAQHIDSHNDVKRYVCEVCGAALSRRNYWARHMLRQHGVSVETPRPGRQKTNFVVGEDMAGATAATKTRAAAAADRDATSKVGNREINEGSDFIKDKDSNVLAGTAKASDFLKDSNVLSFSKDISLSSFSKDNALSSFSKDNNALSSFSKDNNTPSSFSKDISLSPFSKDNNVLSSFCKDNSLSLSKLNSINDGISFASGDKRGQLSLSKGVGSLTKDKGCKEVEGR